MPTGESQRSRHLPLVITLRVLGTIDLLALIAVVLPASAMQWGHELAGLGDFPRAPIAGYLARSASALYALHGMIVLYLSLNVTRYWRLIRFMAILALLHGLAMLGIDLAEGMPTWWTTVEAPAFALTGVAVLWAQWASRPRGHR